MLLVFSAATSQAQQITANIRGTVTDTSGAVVQSDLVSAQDIETGLARSTASDQNGSYLLLELPVGHYQLEVVAKGFLWT